MVTTIALVGGGGLGFYLIKENIIHASSDPLDSKNLEKRTYRTEEIMANYGNGFIKTSFTLVANTEETALEIASRDFQIKNFLIKTISGSSDVTNSKEELLDLQDHLKVYMNEHLQTGIVAEVFMNEKLISQ